MSKVIFGSTAKAPGLWSLVLEHPTATLATHNLDEVIPLLNSVEKAAMSGSWVALMLSYEAAPAFDRALKTHNPALLPLAWAAIFQDSRPLSLDIELDTNPERRVWEPQVSRTEYDLAITRIRELITSGHTYQVNYTFPLRSCFEGDAEFWYHSLCGAQAAGYSAYIDLERHKVLSFSPELFFERQGNLVRTKPMKGTIKRGRWSSEDEDMADRLAASAKDRAENVMIVDLIRNDLGRVAIPGQVSVSRLYEVERYPTLWQMTSTVEATLPSGVRLVDLLAALFPCGSVTGAPKVSTMRIIKDLEPFPRQIYTGAIGLVKPGGDCRFNVAIRTLLIDSATGQATFGVGGGITIDSIAEREYDECLLKSAFLYTDEPVFELLESLLLEDGEYFLFERHLKRLAASARYFGFTYSAADVTKLLEDAGRDHPMGRWKVRLTLSKEGEPQTEVLPLVAEEPRSLRVAIANEPVRSDNRFLFHKTTNRRMYERALVSRPDCDDVILWNERDEITEATIANVVIRKGGNLFTPPLSSGVLPGVFREELLASGKLQERVIRVDELWEAEECFLINSVHKWRAVVGGQ
jgi:para-aminobenzoate synthetase/4-amino-4-deoxychorismate lyase